MPAADYAAALEPLAGEYGGFNLLLMDDSGLHYLSNRPRFTFRAVEPGLHALSNAQLDTPWPKAVAAREALGRWLQPGVDRGPGGDDALFAALADPSRAADAALPETGVGLEMERVLSPAFIVTPGYGTRCTTLVRRGPQGQMRLRERRFDPAGRVTGETDSAQL
jgi:uncharacterized protein with NRDE domain